MDQTSNIPRHSAPAWKPVALSTLLATALACLVLLPLLGHRPLADWDEGIYAEVSREMLSGSWLIPHWNTQLWFEKPPLSLWITAAFFKLFGVNDFWARAGSAFSGIAVVSLLHGWLARKQDQWAAWLCTLLLLSTFGFLHICRVGETDALLSLGCMVSLIGLAEIQQGTPSGWYLFWGGFAVALMTKGAASIVLLLTLFVFAATTRRVLAPRGSKAFLLGLAVFLCAVLPWHLFMLHRFGSDFTQNYIGLHVLHRSTVQLESHHTSWGYYLKVLAVSAFPLHVLVLVPVAARKGHVRTEPVRAFAIFAVVVLVFFTLVQTRLPHYIAPVYPALAVLAASWWAKPLRSFLLSKPAKAQRLAAAAATVAFFALSAWLTSAPRKHLHAPILGDGSPAPDSRESAALLKRAFARASSTPGPLLFWAQPHLAPIASSVFYAQRPVQRVQPSDAPANAARDKYMFDPQSLAAALADGPRLLLIPRSLLPDIPSGYTFHLIDGSSTLALGTLARVPTNPGASETP